MRARFTFMRIKEPAAQILRVRAADLTGLFCAKLNVVFDLEKGAMSALGCDLNGSMQHLDGLGDAVARACLISIT